MERCQPPPEKCDANACANEPNPPRVTLLDVTLPEPDPEGVLDEEPLDEDPPEAELPP
jgi:hypothetical protein